MLLFALLAWWMLYPYATAEVFEPMEVLNDGSPVGINQSLQDAPLVDNNGEEKVVKGDELIIFIQFTKDTTISPEVSRNIICDDGTVYFVDLPPTRSNSRPTGTFRTVARYGLDEATPINTTCYFEFTNEYQVNPIRLIVKKWRSEPFTIVESGEQNVSTGNQASL